MYVVVGFLFIIWNVLFFFVLMVGLSLWCDWMIGFEFILVFIVGVKFWVVFLVLNMLEVGYRVLEEYWGSSNGRWDFWFGFVGFRYICFKLVYF